MKTTTTRFSIRNVHSTKDYVNPDDIQLVLNVPMSKEDKMFVTVITKYLDGKACTFSVPYEAFIDLREAMDMLEEVAQMKYAEGSP